MNVWRKRSITEPAPVFQTSPLPVIAWTAIFVLAGLAASAQTPATVAPQEPAPILVQRQLAPSPNPATTAPKAPVTVLEDTLIRVLTNEPVNSKRAQQGAPVLFTVSGDVLVGDVVVIPRGATVHGVVTKSKKSGVLTGSPELTLQLVSLDLGGRSYPLDSYPFNVKGTSKTGPTETKALRGAEVGAIAGSVAGGVSAKHGVIDDGSGRVASMTAGAVVGAGVGTLVSAATPGPGIWIPSEAQVDFYLAAPVTIVPVSAKEAARLAQGLHSGGPSLYVRDDLR